MKLSSDYYKFLRIHISSSTNLTEPVALSIVLIDIPPLDEFRDFAYPQLLSPQYEFILKYPDPIDTSGAEKYFITIEEEEV